MPQYSPSPALAQPGSSVTSPQRPQPFVPTQSQPGQPTQQPSFNVQPVPNQALSADRSKYPDLASTPLSAQERFHESIEEHIPIAVSDDGYADFTEEKFPNPALPVSAPSVSPGGSAVRNRDTLAAQNGLGASVYSTAFEAFPQQALPKDLEQLLNSLSKEKLKTLFLDTFTLLTMRPPREFRTSNEVLSQFLKKSGMESRIKQSAVLEQWANLVGPEIGAATRALSVMAAARAASPSRRTSAGSGSEHSNMVSTVVVKRAGDRGLHGAPHHIVDEARTVDNEPEIGTSRPTTLHPCESESWEPRARSERRWWRRCRTPPISPSPPV